jgi:CheY-like chemotaxis protein
MSKPLIMAVDDEPQVLRAIGRDLLTRYGRDYRVVRASSGQEAMDVLARERAAAQPLALVLSDQRMPGLDGVTFLAEARTLVPTARRALLTAYADTDAAIGAINRSQWITTCRSHGIRPTSTSIPSSTTCSTTGSTHTSQASVASASPVRAGCRTSTRCASS